MLLVVVVVAGAETPTLAVRSLLISQKGIEKSNIAKEKANIEQKKKNQESLPCLTAMKEEAKSTEKTNTTAKEREKIRPV